MPKKILIIEDDKFLRLLITRKLNQEGFSVIEALDGEEGLKKVKEERPDLVLLDLILPSVDGFEVLTRIQKDEAIKGIPVIILSNLGQREDIEKGIKLGAADYLIKAHFTPIEIVEKVKRILR
jgi:DNA-binding response OmpR family regulator